MLARVACLVIEARFSFLFPLDAYRVLTNNEHDKVARLTLWIEFVITEELGEDKRAIVDSAGLEACPDIDSNVGAKPYQGTGNGNSQVPSHLKRAGEKKIYADTCLANQKRVEITNHEDRATFIPLMKCRLG